MTIRYKIGFLPAAVLILTALILLGAVINNQPPNSRIGWSGHQEKNLVTSTTAPTTADASYPIGTYGLHFNSSNSLLTLNKNRSGVLVTTPLNAVANATGGTVLGNPVGTAGNFQEIPFTVAARTFSAATDATAQRSAIGAVIGTNVQAYDAQLDDLADGSLTGSVVGTGISGTNVTSGTIPNTVLDTQLSSLAALSYTSNALKVVRVNGATSAFELVTPSAGSLLSTDYLIEATGVEATDTAAWIAALNAVKSGTKKRILILGDLELTPGTYENIEESDFELCGVNSDCSIDGNQGGSRLDLGGTPIALVHAAGTALTGGIPKWGSQFTVGTTGLTLGDYFAVWSSDTITGENTPHFATDYPSELHQVVANEATRTLVISGGVTATVHTTTNQVNITGYAVDSSDVNKFVRFNGGTIPVGLYLITAADETLDRWTLLGLAGTAGQTGTGWMGVLLAIMDSPVVDAMTTTPKFTEISLRRAYVHDLTIRGMIVIPSRLTNSVIERVKFIDCSPGPGAVGVGINQCMNLVMNECEFTNMGNFYAVSKTGAGLTIGGTNTGVNIVNSSFINNGHAITTSQASADIAGTPRGVLISNNQVYSSATAGAGNSPLDTHSMGYAVKIDANYVRLSGTNATSGTYSDTAGSCVRIRSRRAIVSNNVFEGDAQDTQQTESVGIQCDLAGGCTMSGNHYVRLGFGIDLIDPYGGHTVKNEQFDQIKHIGIRIYGGDSTMLPTTITGVIGNQHMGDGGDWSLDNAWISILDEDYPITVSGCTLPKSPGSGNDEAIVSNNPGEAVGPSTRAVGNYCFGYGTGDDGVSGSGILLQDNYKDP